MEHICDLPDATLRQEDHLGHATAGAWRPLIGYPFDGCRGTLLCMAQGHVPGACVEVVPHHLTGYAGALSTDSRTLKAADVIFSTADPADAGMTPRLLMAGDGG